MFHDFDYTGNLVPSNRILSDAGRNKLKVNDQDLRHFIALYDGGIRYTDEKLGEFLSFLKQSGIADQSLIVITSDHGEEFKEHGQFFHKQLYYRPNLHVPLIIRMPDYPKRQIRINELVQSIDLLPTIVEIAGLPPHSEAQGRSLLPVIGQNTNFVDNLLRKVSRPFRKNVHFSFAEYKAKKQSRSIITNDGYQMIYNINLDRTFLFNLNDDPLAQNNIAGAHSEITQGFHHT